MVTFIIPTIGRDTLQDSINSLLNQTIKSWNAIIIFDGIKSNIINYDYDIRIKIVEIEKIGLNINNSGNVRNYGMSLVGKNTDWIAFLDDDDILSNDYIETFYNEIYKYEDIDVLIFRMIHKDRIIPKIDTDNFYVSDVGISFIIKKVIYDKNIKFIPDGAEDFMYLDNIRNNGYKIMISPYVKYFVRNSVGKNVIGNRVFINIDKRFI